MSQAAIRAVLLEPNVQAFLKTYLPDRSPEDAVIFLNECKALGLVERGEFERAVEACGFE